MPWTKGCAQDVEGVRKGNEEIFRAYHPKPFLEKDDYIHSTDCRGGFPKRGPECEATGTSTQGGGKKVRGNGGEISKRKGRQKGGGVSDKKESVTPFLLRGGVAEREDKRNQQGGGGGGGNKTSCK